jgi:hypothetical protein
VVLPIVRNFWRYKIAVKFNPKPGIARGVCRLDHTPEAAEAKQMNYQDRRVRIHREEMESLLNLKSKLDHEEAVSSFAQIKNWPTRP